MTHLSIDIETYSSVSIYDSGAYKYARSNDFEIMLFAYSIDFDEVTVIDLAQGQVVPDSIVAALQDPDVIKHAYNAAFEWFCLNQAGYKTPIDQWRCTMFHAMYLGYPAGLATTGRALGLPEDAQKDRQGKALIRYFCMPCKPTKANGGRTRNLPHHDPAKWELFIEYNRQDVVAESAIYDALKSFAVPDREQRLWELDCLTNALGVRVDIQLVNGVRGITRHHMDALMAEAMRITHLANPNSTAQLTAWLREQGADVTDIQKDTVTALLESDKINDNVRRMLEIRQELGKSSVKKYDTMVDVADDRERMSGLMQVYGAGRTGRYCLTGDHEVLTDKGWKRLDEWEGGVIACWHPNGEQASFQKAKSLRFPYEGKMIHYDSKRIDQISTPDHKMCFRRGFGKPRDVDTVENMMRFSRPVIPFFGYIQSSPSKAHINLRVLVMVQADGHFTPEGDVKFSFVKKRKIDRCKYLLRQAKIPYAENVYTVCEKPRHQIKINFRDTPLWLRMFKNKTFGTWLFDESADVFFDELVHWDGYQSAKNSIQYSTINKQNADLVQAFAHLTGRAAQLKVKRRDDKHPNWSDAYVVDIWLTPSNNHEIKNKPVEIDFQGTVYCAETTSGFFFVRRNGKVWITGNSGRLVQPQNMPRNYLKTLDLARGWAIDGNAKMLQLIYGDVMDTLSQLSRTAFIPSEGRKFVIADFSAIEARVIAWLAREQWVMDVFATHGKIYEATASQMFGVPLELITKGRPEYALRQKGKVATLALGYQGGTGSLISMGALDMGLSEEELPEIVSKWRAANPHIVQLWYRVEREALAAMRDGKVHEVDRGVTIALKSDLSKGLNFLTIGLPSGRSLYYVDPFLKTGRFDKVQVNFMTQRDGQWTSDSTYGGKLVENIVQAIARDCLTETLLRLNSRYPNSPVVMHIHDEVVMDAEMNVTVDEICDLMAEPIPWAPGLMLKAAGFESEWYMKD